MQRKHGELPWITLEVDLLETKSCRALIPPYFRENQSNRYFFNANAGLYVGGDLVDCR